MKRLFFVFVFVSTMLIGDTFMKPVNSYVVVDYDVDNCYFCNGKHHTALDYSKNGQSKNIVASNDGIIERVEYSNTNDHGMGNNIIIKHFLKNGNVMYSTYSHLSTISSQVKKGYKITRGEKIGVMGGSGYGKSNYWGVHLHFEMKTRPVTGAPLHGSYWGYTPYSADYHGYLNPNDYIGKIEVKNEILTNGAGIFNGAGSLVAPNDDCFGCNKDIVKLHRENGIGSVGVFQWFYDKNSCSHIDIYSDQDLGNVVIKSKSWANDYVHKAFKVNLGAWDRVSLRPDDTWTTFAVTTEKSLSSTSANLYATCRDSSDSFYNANRSSVSTDPVDVTYGYNWTGTGSLITKANTNTAFGKNKDKANTRTTNSKNAFTTFQWYAKSGCQQVVVSKNGLNTNVPINDISIKGWSQSNDEWKKQNCSSLPCTISTSSKGYYILKIATNKNALDGEHLQVKCK